MIKSAGVEVRGLQGSKVWVDACSEFQRSLVFRDSVSSFGQPISRE